MRVRAKGENKPSRGGREVHHSGRPRVPIPPPRVAEEEQPDAKVALHGLCSRNGPCFLRHWSVKNGSGRRLCAHHAPAREEALVGAPGTEGAGRHHLAPGRGEGTAEAACPQKAACSTHYSHPTRPLTVSCITDQRSEIATTHFPQHLARAPRPRSAVMSAP